MNNLIEALDTIYFPDGWYLLELTAATLVVGTIFGSIATAILRSEPSE